MANPGNQQDPALQFHRPDPPQPKLSHTTPTHPVSLVQALDGAGFHEAAAAVRQNIDFPVEYDLGAFFGASITDAKLGSAAWETWATVDTMCQRLHTVINNQGLAAIDLDKNNEELRTQLATLQTQFNVQSVALATSTTALAESNANANPAAPYKKSIAKDPASFDASDKDATKRHTAFENWRSKIAIRWAQDEHEFPSEHRKILHIAGLLSGAAYQGVRTNLETIIANSGDPTQWKWQSGADLLAYHDATYRTFDVAADAEKKLSLLSQKDDYANYTDFITEFTSLADRAGIDDATRVRFLRDKVTARIRKAAVNQVPQPERADWPAWQKLYSALAKNIEHDEFLTKTKTGTNQGNGNRENSAPAKKDPDAMDLSSARVGTNGNAPRGPITPEERQHRLANGLCKRCGGPGHIAAFCTPAARAANRPAPRSPRGGGAPRGRGGGRGGFGNPCGAPYHSGGRGGYGAPTYPSYPQQQYNQYPPPQQYGPQVRLMTTDTAEQPYYPEQHDYNAYTNTSTHTPGYVVGEVQDENPGDQGKEHPPR